MEAGSPPYQASESILFKSFCCGVCMCVCCSYVNSWIIHCLVEPLWVNPGIEAY